MAFFDNADWRKDERLSLVEVLDYDRQTRRLFAGAAAQKRAALGAWRLVASPAAAGPGTAHGDGRRAT